MPSTNPRYANSPARKAARRRLLYEQDHCAICGQLIDKSLKTPDPMSAEVDEIVPLSLGGSPISAENLQLVHRRCNQRKSNRMVPEHPTEHPLPLSRRW